jgi:TonB-dependent starch-binding outer membrane protein SusC
MKMYKLQTDLLLKPLLGRIAFSGKIAGMLIIFNCAASTFLFARKNHNHGFKEEQNFAIPVTGRVTDENNNPLAGVTVQVKKSNTTTTTNETGSFSITVPDKKAVLVFTYVGFESQEVVAGSNNFSIQLKHSNTSLGEVVVVGYGTQKRISVTGAVDRVSGAAAVDGRPALNTTQLLQGESPNLIIQQRGFVPNGGSFNINIRGTGTTGNNNPLVVIDGIIGGDMNTLNPNDIDNISVLKDAGSAAIYGSRSANGVILITTKKGKAGSKPTLSYNGIYGNQHAHQQFQPVPQWQNATLKNISLENSGKPDAYTQAQIDQFKAQGDGNWRLNTLLHDAPQINQNISLSGGSPTSTYLMSFGYFNQQSNLTKSLIDGAYGIKRYNFRLNQTATLGKFTIASNLSYVKTQINEPSVGDPSGLIGDVFRAPLSDNFQDSQGRYLTGFVTSNGLDILRNGGYRFSNNDAIDGSFTAGYAITPAFKVRAVFGGNVQANTQLRRFVDLKYFPTGETNASKQTQNTNYKQLATNVQLLAEYTKNFGKHDVNILVGAANESFKSEGNGVSKSATDSLLGVPTTGTTIDAGTTNNSYNSLTNTSETSLNSFFGRVTYSYDNKYFLEGTFRADASSNFPKNKRWGYFPSIGGSWRLTEEKFMSGYKAKVGDIKIRSSYGILGNQSVNPYQFISTFSTNANTYGFNNSAVAGATRNLANPDLTWEKAATFDIGADLTFLQGKLNFGFDYFNKITSDILAPRADVPTLFGSSFPTYNVSKVQVRGWEAKVTYSTRGHAFNHSFSFNIADNLSKLLAYSYGQTEKERNLTSYIE